ncbi:response regulator transcription factor [Microbulbifer marinus]|uniref:Regulatory protein, luxR family n=1 Tax=Microbulbifer marinus TaxID=658218 RepID=A0A1H3XJF0_9GAMM|nr:response regulator transcription factor [Microbulbifer marinus]SDZ99469.1 regulatory protein, luxR family [Microbulbifer marinus]
MPVLFVSNSGPHGDFLFALISDSLPFRWEKAEIGKQRHCLRHYQAIVIDGRQMAFNSGPNSFFSYCKNVEHPKVLIINSPAKLPNHIADSLKKKRFQLVCDVTSDPDHLIKKLANALQSPATLLEEDNQTAALLTRREQEILTQVTTGKPNRVIASNLYLSEHTVKNHIYNIFRKIGAKNRSQASNWARTHLQVEQI